MSRPRPPATAMWLLSHLLPERERESLIGDLEEMYRSRQRSARWSIAARLWFWRETIGAIVSAPRRRQADDPYPTTRGMAMSDRFADVRYAVRQVARSPLLSSISVALLAVGVGVNAALLSVVDTRIANPVPGVPNPTGLVEVHVERGGRPGALPRLTYEEFLEFQERQSVFQGVAATVSMGIATTPIVDLGEQTFEASPVFVSGQYFAVTRPRMALGSPLPTIDDRGGVGDAVAVVSHSFWRTRLAGDSAIIGRAIRVNRVPFTILGVLPRGFQPAGVRHTTELWIPLSSRPLLSPGRAPRTTAGGAPLIESMDGIIARIHPTIGLDQAAAAANATIAAIGARLRPESPLTGASLEELGDLTNGEFVIGSAVIGNFTLLILLTACANVSILLLGRAVTRRREIAIRLALGAGRMRVVHLLLVESVLLALVASSGGLLIAHWICEFFNARFPGMGTDYALSWRSVLATLVFAVATGVVFGLTPALHATRASVSDALKAGSSSTDRHQSRLQRVFVVAEVALSMALVCSAWLLVNAFGRMVGGRPYDVSDRVLLADVEFSRSAGGAQYTPERADAVLSEIRGLLGARDGVTHVSFATAHPLGRNSGSSVVVTTPDGDAGSESDRAGATLVVTDPDYFAASGHPLVEGRDLSRSDTAGTTRVTVVGEQLAARLWPRRRRVGGTVMVGVMSRAGRGGAVDTTYFPYSVVGVAREREGDTEGSRNVGRLYLPRLQLSPTEGPRVSRDMTLIVRTSDDAREYAQTIGQAFRVIDPNLPVMDVSTARERHFERSREEISLSNGIILAGLITLFMACVGMYAVIAFGINQRTREIGIRMALGARRSQVVALFFGDGMRLALIGFFIGIPLSLIAMKLALGRQSGDILTPGSILIVIAGLLIVAALASWLPARRAAGVNPMEAARSE